MRFPVGYLAAIAAAARASVSEPARPIRDAVARGLSGASLLDT